MPYSLQHARQALRSRHADDRLRAVEELSAIQSSEASAVLVGALKDRVSYIGAAAAMAIGKRATVDIADALVAHFGWASENGPERDAGCSVRQELAVILGNLRHHKADQALRMGIRTVQIEWVGMGKADTAVGLRANCALALAQIRPPGVLVDMALLLFEVAPPELGGADDTATSRRAAARAIGALGDPAGAVPLILLLAEQNKVSRSAADAGILVEAMESLVNLQEPRALEFIAPFLSGSDPFLVAGAAVALAKTRSPEALAQLLAALDEAASEAAPAVAMAIASTRLSAAREALLERSGSGPAIVRSACAQAMAVFPDSEVRRRLQEMRRTDLDRRVRTAAVQSLGDDS